MTSTTRSLKSPTKKILSDDYDNVFIKKCILIIYDPIDKVK